MAEEIKSVNSTETAEVEVSVSPEEEVNLKTLRAKAESLTKEYNDAYQTGDFNRAKKLDEEIQQVVNQYTNIAREECFKTLLNQEDPMIAAVTMLTFSTIRTKDTKVGEAKTPVRSVEDSDKAINLLKLHQTAENGIGRDPKWSDMIEKLNFLMTAQKAVDLGIDPKKVNDSYAMSEIARSIDMGKTPTSKTNILKTVQSIVTAMIGEEYKATSHDVNFLFSVYSRKNRKALTVTCANHKYMRQYMAEICHRIVTNGSYELDYKQVKTK